MTSKIACTVFLVFFVSVAKANSLGDLSRVGDINSLVVEFRKESVKAVRNVLKRTVKAELSLYQWSEYEVNRTENQIRLLDAGWRRELWVIEERAKKANVSIDECVGRRKTVLDNIPRNFSKVLENNINETYEKADEEGKLFFTEFNKTLAQRSDEFKREIVACANATNSTRCLQELTAIVQFELDELPKAVEYETLIHEAKIISLLGKVQKFSVEELRKWESIGDSIIREIFICAERKIPK